MARSLRLFRPEAKCGRSCTALCFIEPRGGDASFPGNAAEAFARSQVRTTKVDARAACQTARADLLRNSLKTLPHAQSLMFRHRFCNRLMFRPTHTSSFMLMFTHTQTLGKDMHIWGSPRRVICKFFTLRVASGSATTAPAG